MGKVSVVIPTIKERKDKLAKLLKSLPKDVQVIIVRDEDLSLAEKRNKGAKKARYKYILFIDDDNIVKKGSLERMVKLWDDKNTGVMGMVACYQSDRLKIADGGSKRNKILQTTTDDYVNQNIGELPYDLYAVDEVANAFMVRRQVFRKLDGLDSYRFPIDLDEADLCRRAKKAGYDVVMNPHAICYHDSQTYSRLPDFRRPKNAYYMGRNKILYIKKHGDYLAFLFVPAIVIGYCCVMAIRKKPNMIFHFLKGVFDGLRNCIENKY